MSMPQPSHLVSQTHTEVTVLWSNVGEYHNVMDGALT